MSVQGNSFHQSLGDNPVTPGTHRVCVQLLAAVLLICCVSRLLFTQGASSTWVSGMTIFSNKLSSIYSQSQDSIVRSRTSSGPAIIKIQTLLEQINGFSRQIQGFEFEVFDA